MNAKNIYLITIIATSLAILLLLIDAESPSMISLFSGAFFSFVLMITVAPDIQFKREYSKLVGCTIKLLSCALIAFPLMFLVTYLSFYIVSYLTN